jgi:predicted SprT family Zn-dependent metalloprotease
MKTVSDVINKAVDLMTEEFTVTFNGRTVTTSAKKLGYTIELDKRAVRRLGQHRPGRREIGLSVKYLQLNVGVNNADIEDTIRHEIAHAIAYHHFHSKGHDTAWKKVAEQVGAQPNRLRDASTINITPPKYTLSCGTCGATMYRQRIPRSGAACSNCCSTYNGGRYSSKYELRVKRNH